MLVLVSVASVKVLSATVISLAVTALITKSLLFALCVTQPDSVTPSPALKSVVRSVHPLTVILFFVNLALLPVTVAASGFIFLELISRYTLSGHITIFVLITANCFCPAVTVPIFFPSYSRDVPCTTTSFPHAVIAVAFL